MATRKVEYRVVPGLPDEKARFDFCCQRSASVPEQPLSAWHPSHIALLVGERLTYPAVYPAGSFLVHVVSSPLPVYILNDKEKDNNPDSAHIPSPVTPTASSSDPDNSGEGAHPADAVPAVATNLSKQQRIQMAEPKKPLPDVHRLPFSFWRCLTAPQIASDPSKSRGFLVCRVTIGTCMMHHYSLPSNPHDEVPFSKAASSMNFSTNSETGCTAGDSLSYLDRSYGDIPNAVLPFLVVHLGDRVVYRTRVITVPGAWNEVIDVDLHTIHDSIGFELFDKDFGSDCERLGGIRVSAARLQCHIPYSTSVELALTLPASVTLLSALRAAQLASAPGRCDSSLEALDTAEGSVSLDALDVNQAQHIRLKVSITLTVTPSKRMFTGVARLGAAALSGRNPTVPVPASPPHILRIQRLVQHLKRITWDLTCLPLWHSLYALRRWDKPLESGTALFLVWFCVFYSNYCVPFVLAALTMLFWTLPALLPPLPLFDLSSVFTDVDGCTHPNTSVNAGAPAVFFAPLLTDALMSQLKYLETMLLYFVPFVDSVCCNLRNPSSAYRYLVMILGVMGTVCVLTFPSLSGTVVKSLLTVLFGYRTLSWMCPSVSIVFRFFQALWHVIKFSSTTVTVETF